jgi:hypothetical protein
MTTAKWKPGGVKQNGIDAMVITDVGPAYSDLLAHTIPRTKGGVVYEGLSERERMGPACEAEAVGEGGTGAVSPSPSRSVSGIEVRSVVQPIAPKVGFALLSIHGPELFP